MNVHDRFADRLPLYVAGQLTGAGCAEIERHLAECPVCRADLVLWQFVSTSIIEGSQALPAPPNLAERALAQIHARQARTPAWQRAWQLLHAQAALMQRNLWPASAAVMALGLTVALISERSGIIYFLAPLVAATSLAVLYGPDRDPLYELALSTPTSPWKVLLARLTLVFGYDLLLTLAVTSYLIVFLPSELLGSIIIGWLGPMTFLSALALLLSLRVGTSNALLVSYGLWLVQFAPLKAGMLWTASSPWLSVFETYQQLWRSPVLLLLLSVLLVGMALWSTGRPSRLQLQ